MMVNVMLFSRYLPETMVLFVARVTDLEFDPILWRDDPDMDVAARDVRDMELMMDLTGNLDSCA